MIYNMSPQRVTLILINLSFHLACFTTAGYFILHQIIEYYKNHDLSYVSYKTFNDMPEDLYPSFSVCIYSSDPSQLVVPEKLTGTNLTLSPYLYSDMLRGYYNTSKEFIENPFDNITINFPTDMMIWFHKCRILHCIRSPICIFLQKFRMG